MSLSKYLWVFVLAHCYGCSIWWIPQIEDLRFVSVKLVDMQNEQIFNPTKSPLAAPAGRMLKVQFATFSDLGAMSLKHELNLSNEAILCGGGSHLLGSAAIYYHDVHVTQFKRSSSEYLRYQEYASQLRADNPYIYHLYIRSRSDRKYSLSADWVINPYDLSHQPEDLCIRIRGGNMLGGTIRTNTFIVPKEQIGQVLKGEIGIGERK